MFISGAVLSAVMSFESDIKNYIVENTEDKQTMPYDFTVEPCEESVWDTDDDKDIVVVGKWEKDGDIAGIDRRMVYPDKGSPLYNDIAGRLDEVRSRVETNGRNVSMSALSISPTHEVDDPESEFAPEWAGEITSDYRAMFKIDFQSGIEEKEYALVREILDTFEEDIGDSLLMSDYEEVVLHFSDFMRCEVSTIKSDVLTDSPHVYYKEVESVEEYCEVVSEDDEEYEEMIEQDTYSVFARLDYKDGDIDKDYIPENVRDKSESLMSSRIDQLVDIDGEKIFEAESIVVEPEEASTCFWVRVPVNGFR